MSEQLCSRSPKMQRALVLGDTEQVENLHPKPRAISSGVSLIKEERREPGSSSEG